jgi:type II secretory pathway predicted ATPase ExeA
MNQRWRTFLQELQPNAPLRDMRLYIKPRYSSTDEVVRSLVANPSACRKFLLVGARGGGKSTELRAIRDSLSLAGFLLAEVDLDQSGIRAGSVSAYDLLYISALALLKLLPESQEAERKTLFQSLARTYAGSDAKQTEGLGDWRTALEGIAGFATAAAGAAQAADLLTGGVPVVSATATLAAHGLRLLESKQEVVAESSPRGRSMQEVTTQIARAVRLHHKGQQLCVLIDGLEKMNGESAERFDQIFVQTRLLADTDWAAVIAAPPCTFTDTSSVEAQGFKTRPVYGFGPDHLDQLRTLLERRFLQAELDPNKHVDAESLQLVVEKSGGLPRHAIAMIEGAAERAFMEGTDKLSKAQVEQGIRDFAQELGRGLADEHLRALVNVSKRGRISVGKGASLFADGRILVYPPKGDSPLPHFVVHPLLRQTVEQLLLDGGDST